MEKNSISLSHPAQPKEENLSIPEFQNEHNYHESLLVVSVLVSVVFHIEKNIKKKKKKKKSI